MSCYCPTPFRRWRRVAPRLQGHAGGTAGTNAQIVGGARPTPIDTDSYTELYRCEIRHPLGSGARSPLSTIVVIEGQYVAKGSGRMSCRGCPGCLRHVCVGAAGENRSARGIVDFEDRLGVLSRPLRWATNGLLST